MNKTGFFRILFFSASLILGQTLHAQWTTAALSQGRYGIAAAVTGNKAIFAGGEASAYLMSNHADIYDANTDTWSIKLYTEGRKSIAPVTLDDRVLFAGGIGRNVNGFFYSKKVDIYNNTTGVWSSKTLSQARAVGGVGAANGKAVFAGGVKATNPTTYQPVTTNRVDIYDYASNAFTSTSLSTSRSGMAVASVGNKIIFAGGIKSYKNNGYAVVSDVVDIYDAVANTWSTATLSTARTGIAAVVIGTKAYFAGGYKELPTPVFYNTVDVFDAATNTWSTTTLSQARAYATAIVAGDLAFFAGGLMANAYSDRVDMFDSANDTWSTTSISFPRSGLVPVVTNHRVMFAGGGSLGYTTPIEVYDLDNGNWSVEYLSQARVTFAGASVNNKAIFAGGRASSGYPFYGSAVVDIYQDLNSQPLIGTDPSAAPDFQDFTVYPNPAKETAYLDLQTVSGEYQLRLVDISGKIMREWQTSGGQIVEMPLGDLPQGMCFVQVIAEGKLRWTGRLLIL